MFRHIVCLVCLFLFPYVGSLATATGSDALLAVDPALGRTLEMCLVVGRGVGTSLANLPGRELTHLGEVMGSTYICSIL